MLNGDVRIVAAMDVPGNLRKGPTEKASEPKPQEFHKKIRLREREFDLTELRVPTIIMCTSLLWRANKPGVGTAGYQGWRQNIFL